MKKYLYSAIAIILGLFIITSCSNSEYGNLVPNKYHKIAYFKNSGENSLSLYTTQTNYQDTLIVLKGGSDQSLAADLKVNVMTQSDVDSIYSNVEGVDYKIIPQDAYSFNNGQDVSIGKGETGKYLTMTINPLKIYQQITANPGVKYVLPLQLISNKKDSVNSDLDKILCVINVTIPTISFQSGSQTAEMIYKTLNVNVPMNLSSCDSNRWNFNCSLDESQNSQLVASYNASNGTSYEVLPDNSYSISGLGFTKGNFQDTATVSINRSYLQNDHTYLLPLSLAGTTMGNEMAVSSTVDYLIVSNPTYGIVEPDRSQWKILFDNNDNKFTGSSSDNGGPYTILDGNLETYWHSNEGSASASSASSDDYDYNFTDYNAFLDTRNANQTVFVIDMETPKHLVGVGITQRDSKYKDLKSCDIYVSNDASFNFKPFKSGGTLADYDAVALNNWTKLCSVTVPQQSATFWQEANSSIVQNGGITGRFIKISFTGSYRSQYLNMAEFQVMELLSIDGNPVE